MIGLAPKIFKAKIRPGSEVGLEPWRHRGGWGWFRRTPGRVARLPCLLPLGFPFRGRGGAVSGPESRRFIFPGEVWGRISECRCSRRARSARRRATAPVPIPSCRCFRCQHRPVPHLWPWSESETGTLGRDSILPGHYDLPEKFFDFPGRFPIQALFARVPIYERYGKISGRAYSGKIVTLWGGISPSSPRTGVSPANETPKINFLQRTQSIIFPGIPGLAH